MRYPHLIFDLYGTLVDIHTEESAAVWRKTALFFGFYGARYTGPQLRTACERLIAGQKAAAGQGYECFPEIQIETVFAALFRQKGVEPADALGLQAAQLFRILSIRYLRLYPGVKEALAALRARGHRLWLLTNAQRAFTAYELRALDLQDCFDGIYISSDLGCAKPDGRFYRALLDQQQLCPAHCLMIGNDRGTDIAGAKAAGMASLYLHTNLSPAADAPAGAADGSDARRPAADLELETSDWTRIDAALRELCRTT